jgi:acyl carrier protein
MSVTPGERFFGVLSSVLNVPHDLLGPESSRDSVDPWDSIKHISVVMALEEEFGIEFTDREIADLSSASALMQAIEAKTGISLPWR